MTKREAQKRFNQASRQKRKWEAYWEPRINRALRAQIEPVIKFLRQFGPVQTLALLDTLLLPGPIDRVLSDLYRRVGVEAGNLEYGDLMDRYGEDLKQTKAFGFNRLWADIMNAFYSLIGAEHVTSITNTERNRIRKVLMDGVENNLTIDEYVRELRSEELTKARSRVIARTETLMASAKGSDTASKQSGLVLNLIWLSAEWSDRTRRIPRDSTDHAVMNLKTVREGEYFVVPNIKGNNLMLYPGDNNAPVSQLANCRCGLAREAARDANGRLLRR